MLDLKRPWLAKALALSMALWTGDPVLAAFNAPANLPTTYDLVQNFKAACNGSADDTTKIQAWLNEAGPNVTLTAPAGQCNFSSALTVGAVSSYTLTGAGPYATVFKYTGAATTSTLLTINAPNTAAVKGIAIRDFRITSGTVMTGGFAFQANGLFNSVITDVVLEGSSYNNGNLCGGYWFNGAASVDLYRPDAQSAQNCKPGLLVNANLGGTAELRIYGGNIGGSVSSGVVSGFAQGLYMGGGFGGLRCYGTNVHNNLVGLQVDTAIVATANRDVEMHCDVDSNQTYGVWLNDTLASGATADLDDWVASTQQGDGVYIESWPNGDIEVRGSKVFNNCGAGIFDVDTTAYLLISTATAINSNGAALSAPCSTWQAGSGTGHTNGVRTTPGTTFSRIFSTNTPFGNIGSGYGGGTINAKNVIQGGSSAVAFGSVGSAPPNTGTCAITTQVGGNTSGSFVASGACSGGTVKLSFGITAGAGWSCSAHDLTTPTDSMNETSYDTTHATFTGTMANSDLITFSCTMF